jgi:hypothetical protein
VNSKYGFITVLLYRSKAVDANTIVVFLSSI